MRSFNPNQLAISLIFTFLYLSTSFLFATTYYSIQDGDWDDPATWSLTREGSAGTQVPTSTDHVVIRHHVIHSTYDGYTFYGDVQIELSGHFQVNTGNGATEPYIFGGDYFEIEGMLTSSSDFQHQVQGTSGNGLLYIGTSAILNIGDDLILNASGNTIMENAACGSGFAFDDLYFVGEDARICGNGKFVVPDRIRSWLNNGTELTSLQSAMDQVQNQMCSGFTLFGSPADCNNGVPMLTGIGNFSLPVEWLDISVEESPFGTQINWTTASETNNNYFVVEKSLNGRDFQAIGQVEAEGNTQQHSHYNFLDQQQFSAPTYYRIRQVDIDGQFSFSPTIEFTPQFEQKGISIIPNPNTGDKLQVLLPSFAFGENLRQVSIVDMQGRLMFEERLDGFVGRNLQLAGLGLPPGWYSLQVVHRGGNLARRFWVK